MKTPHEAHPRNEIDVFEAFTQHVLRKVYGIDVEIRRRMKTAKADVVINKNCSIFSAFSEKSA